MTRRTFLAVAAIAAAAFAFRVAVVAVASTPEPGGGDPRYYHVQANLLADGHGFAEPFTWEQERRVTPSAIHPPGFSIWLAAASVLGFESVFAHKVMSALAGALTVGVLGLIAATIGGSRAAIASAVAAAVHPNLWVIDDALMPEALFGLATAAVLLSAYRTTTLRRAGVLGAAIGVAALVRGEALAFAPLLGAWAAWRLGANVRERFAYAAVVLAAAALVVAPWTVRNLLTFDHPVVISANGDEVLRNANCDITWSGPLVGFWSVDCYEPEPPPHLDEAERAAFWRRAGVAYARSHIGELPEVLAARVGRVWGVFRPTQNLDLSTVEGRDRDVAAWGQVGYVVLWPVAIAGAVVLHRRREPVWPLLATGVVVTVTAVYAYGVIRFRLPAELAMIVLAGVAVGAIRAPAPRAT